MTQQQKTALAMIRFGCTTEQVVASTGYNEWSVYRLAAEHSLKVHRRRLRQPVTDAGTVRVVYRTNKKDRRHSLYPEVHVGSPFLRAAGITQGAVNVVVEPGRIILTAETPKE